MNYRRDTGIFCRTRLFILLCASLIALPTAAEDAIPVRRFVLPAERLPKEMERLKQGVLVQLPRAEFEERLRQANQATAALKNPPRLVEAHYQAVLADSALVGSGQWQVFQAGPGPGLLPLPSFNLALRQIPTQDRDEVPLAEFGKTPAVLLDGAGNHRVDLEWSARADVRPDGLHFELKIPTSPLATLALCLPGDWTVSVLQEGTLLEGPLPLPREGDTSPEDGAALKKLLAGDPRLGKALPPGSRLWKVHCGAPLSRVSVVLRPTDRPGPARLLVQRQQTVQVLHPDVLEARYELELETLHKGVRELVCECDPGLRPYAVSLRNLDGWEVKPGVGPNSPSLLVLRLKEPIHDGLLQVACLAPLGTVGPADLSARAGVPREVAWTSPGLRLLQAVPRGETLVLKVHPDVRLEDWHPGGFRLAESATEPDPERKVPAENWQRLTLVGGGVGEPGAVGNAPRGVPIGAARPRARLQAHGVEFRARQLAWWQPGPARMTLTAQITYDVSHGQLFQLPVQLPAGWEVERVEMTPAALLGPYRVYRVAPQAGTPRDRDRAILLVSLQLPLSGKERSRTLLGVPREKLPALAALTDLVGPGLLPGPVRPATLTVVLHANRPRLAAGKPGRPDKTAVPFPDLVPLGARFREGALALGIDAANQLAEVQTAAPRSEPEEDGPWGKINPDFFYLYRGQPIQGTLTLQARPARLRARCTSEVYLAAGQAAIDSHLQLEAEAGGPEVIDLFLSAGAVKTWNWQSGSAGQALRAERLVGREAAAGARLLSAAGGQLLTAAVLAAASPLGQHWRLTLAQPLRPGEPLLLHTSGTLEPGQRALEKGNYRVPLPVVLHAARMEGEVTLHLAGADLVQVETLGLQELSGGAVPGTRGTTAWRAFRYGERPVGLILRTGAATSAHPGKETVLARPAQVGAARLTTWLTPDGALQHHFAFQVSGWQERSLPVSLPPGTRLLAAAVDGRWLADLSAHAGVARHGRDGRGTAEDSDLELPMPAPPDRVTPDARDPAGPLPPPLRQSTHFEIVYVQDVAPWWLWARLEAPVPSLPTEPVSLRRDWRLPPGLKPLPDGWPEGNLTRSRGRRGALSWLALGRFAEALALPVGRRDTSPVAWLPADSSRDLGKAWTADLSAHAGVPRLLGWVEQLATVAWKEGRPLVVDEAALRELGLGPLSFLHVPADAGSEDRQTPWEKCGLAVVAFPSGLVLTSQSQLTSWQEDGGWPRADDVDPLVLEAVHNGNDASGRFRHVQEWALGLEPGTPASADRSAASASNRPLLTPGGPPGQWHVLEAGSELVVVRGGALRAAALLLSLALLGLFVRGKRSARRRLLFLWVWLGGAGLAWIWLPPPLETLAWWPLLVGLLLAAGWYGFFLAAGSRRAEQPRSPSTQIRPEAPAAAGVGAALVLLLLAAQSWGEVGDPLPVPVPPAPHPVYLMPDVPRDGTPPAPEADGGGSVLVTPELLEQIRVQSRSGGPNGDARAVVLSATYDGQVVEEGKAQVDAVFQVLALEESVISLPLDGVWVQGPVWLDGGRVEPLPLSPPADRPRDRPTGYAVKLPPGRHKLELHFRVKVSSLTDTPEARQVQFGVPHVPCSRLRFQAPPGAVALQALTCQGWQRLLGERRGVSPPVPPADPAKAGPVLEVDLGRMTAPVQLSWYHEAGADRKAGQVHFEEAYVWELRGDASSLSGLVHYKVQSGTVTSLVLDLPAELEVRGAEAFRVLPHKGAALEPLADGSVRLRDWRTSGEGKGRRLHLDFQGPVTGEFAVSLDLVPRTAVPATFTLPLPVPHGQPLPGLSYLGFRTQGLKAERADTLRVTGIRSAGFAPFWPASMRPPAKALDQESGGYCCYFRREPNNPPLLQVRLHWLPPEVQAVQEVSLRLGRQQAELRATLDLTVSKTDGSAPLVLVEWDVQAAGAWTVAGVFGPEVRRWTQNGSRLLVWLERSSSKVRLELAGWLALAPDPNRSRLDLPWLHVPTARSQKTTLRLSAEPGLQLLVPGPLQNLQAGQRAGSVSNGLPGPSYASGSLASRGVELVYQTVGNQLRYGGPVFVQAGLGGEAANVQVLTLAEVVDRQLTFCAVVVQRLRQGEGRTLQVRLRDWPGEPVEVKAGGVAPAVVRERGLATGARIWTVELPAGPARLVPITLRGRLPVTEARLGIWMPDVSVVGVLRQEHWLALAGKELNASVAQGLVAQPDLGQTLAAWRQAGAGDLWAGEAERLRKSGGTVWRTGSPGDPAAATAGWQLRLLPRLEQPLEVSPLRVFLSEHAAALTGGRWLHEADYWVQQQASTDLNVMLPAAATILAVTLDGREVTPLQPEPRRLWLPLAGSGGVRHLRVRFRYEGTAEQADRPLLEQPRLEGAVTGPTLWTLHVPAGYSPREHGRDGRGTSAGWLKAGRSRAATLALYRAAAQEQICAVLSERPPAAGTESQLAAAGERLARACRLAEQDLELAGTVGSSGSADEGPDGQSLPEWLARLKTRAQQEAARARPEAGTATASAPPTAALDPSPFLAGVLYRGFSGSDREAPRPRLVSGQSQRRQAALLASAEWLGLLAVVWVVSLLPYLPAWARLLWPEQLLVLAGLGWYVGGLPWTGLVLAVVWSAARGVKAMAWLRR